MHTLDLINFHWYTHLLRFQEMFSSSYQSGTYIPCHRPYVNCKEDLEEDKSPHGILSLTLAILSRNSSQLNISLLIPLLISATVSEILPQNGKLCLYIGNIPLRRAGEMQRCLRACSDSGAASFCLELMEEKMKCHYTFSHYRKKKKVILFQVIFSLV